MKPFPAVLKEKKRYVIFEIISEKRVKEDAVKKAFFREIKSFIGINGMADAAPTVVYFDEKSKKGVLKVDNRALKQVEQALSLIREISFNKCFVHIIKTTGTVKKAKELVKRGD